MTESVSVREPDLEGFYKPCIIIPVYNHEHAIGIFLEQLLVHRLPVFLVNDGSSDTCKQILEQLEQKYSTVFLVNLPVNQGKGAAVKKGFQVANEKGFSHALQIDADGQHLANDVEKFLAESRRHPEAVISGYPIYDESVPAHRFYARYLTHVWICINTLSLKIKDSMCGFRFYPLKPICELVNNSNIGNRMDFDSEILVRWVWRKGKIINLPTRVSYPLDGVSHFQMWRDNVLISKMHTRLFFGMLIRFPVLIYRRLVTND